MAITTLALRKWLEREYHGYAVEGEPVHGTYGLIWFLTAKSGNPVVPETFAVKTVVPEKITQGSTLDEVKFLRREFRIWLALPSTYNVLPAFGFDFAYLSDGSASINLPVMRMPRMDGSLQEWVSKPSPAQVVDRLLALSQALNGLQSLYDHGFEGHGDLKPSNLLYENLRTKFQLYERASWPSVLHPWHVQVADLGWADAWVDLGYSRNVLRQYMAPERIEGTVVPIKSDMFSMGVIASELLQGHHPVGNIKKVRSDDKWKRWVESGERILAQIESPRLRHVIEKCLHPAPGLRPSAQEFLGELCTELRVTYSIDIEQTLKLWRSGVFGDNRVARHEHEAWAAAQSPRLGGTEKQASLEQIEKKMKQVNVIDFESCETWAPLAEAFVLLTGDTPEEQGRIRTLASHYLATVLGPLSDSAIKQLGRRSDLPFLKEYERFNNLVSLLAHIAAIDENNSSELLQKLGSTARGALYFSFASGLRNQKGNRPAIEMLSSAIAEAPNEAAHYYFRARWNHEILLDDAITRSVTASTMKEIAEVLDTATNEQIVQDLATATKLDPDWDEPRVLFESQKAKLEKLRARDRQ